mgnify:FL=1
MEVKIAGTGSYVPEKLLTNEELERMVDTSDSWIRERTGIGSRRISSSGTADMAARAAERALADAGLEAGQIELILVGTSTGDCLFPSTACQVQEWLGASGAACFDVSAACSGFLYALNTAAVYLETGQFRNALVIGADAMSKAVDWTDRSTCILFGDGAGAVVLEAGMKTENPAECAGKSGSGLGPFVLGADGSRGSVLRCSSDNDASAGLTMNGQEVFRFAVRVIPEVIGQVLEKASLSAEEIRYFLLHQANRRIIEAAAKRMKQPLSRFPMNLEHYGNTSAASIPVLLDELARSGTLKCGDLLVLAGFGAGLTWGAAVLRWSKGRRELSEIR